MLNILERLTGTELAIVKKHMAETPVKLGALAKELGLIVLSSTLEPGISGEIQKITNSDKDEKFQIKINRHENKERQRFTLAHEISHFLLHRSLIGDGLKDDILYRSKLSNLQEVEANKLAAEILMPANLVKNLKATNMSINEAEIEEFSKIFGVSKEAIMIRFGAV